MFYALPPIELIFVRICRVIGWLIDEEQPGINAHAVCRKALRLNDRSLWGDNKLLSNFKSHDFYARSHDLSLIKATLYSNSHDFSDFLVHWLSYKAVLWPISHDYWSKKAIGYPKSHDFWIKKVTGSSKSHDYWNRSHDFRRKKLIQWYIQSICYRVGEPFQDWISTQSR